MRKLNHNGTQVSVACRATCATLSYQSDMPDVRRVWSATACSRCAQLFDALPGLTAIAAPTAYQHGRHLQIPGGYLVLRLCNHRFPFCLFRIRYGSTTVTPSAIYLAPDRGRICPNGWFHTSASGGWEYPAFLIAAPIALWLREDGTNVRRRNATKMSTANDSCADGCSCRMCQSSTLQTAYRWIDSEGPVGERGRGDQQICLLSQLARLLGGFLPAPQDHGSGPASGGARVEVSRRQAAHVRLPVLRRVWLWNPYHAGALSTGRDIPT